MTDFDDMKNVYLQDGTYKYQGAKLTPRVFADVLVHLFDGRQFSRKEAIDCVLNFHIANGGLSHLNSYAPTFKKACSYLKGSLRNVVQGTWELKYEKKDIRINTDAEVTPQMTIEDVFPIDRKLGSGPQTVYVYYYDAYKELAPFKAKHNWPCKIGLTEDAAQKRILDQSGTAYPEYPHIALAISCDNAHNLESALHSILKVKRRWIQNAPGTEWFMTTPEEVASIFEGIIQD